MFGLCNVLFWSRSILMILTLFYYFYIDSKPSNNVEGLCQKRTLIRLMDTYYHKLIIILNSSSDNKS